jgi:hypothetical protein
VWQTQPIGDYQGGKPADQTPHDLGVARLDPFVEKLVENVTDPSAVPGDHFRGEGSIQQLADLSVTGRIEENHHLLEYLGKWFHLVTMRRRERLLVTRRSG